MTPTDDEKYEAVARRDQNAVPWLMGVITTGVFCRPGCAGRIPKRENVRFYDSPEDAVADGLRPCLRCRPTAERPLGPQAARMRKLCRYIREHAAEPLTLELLSVVAGLSPTHLQRVFTESIGVSPKVYAEACRLQTLRGLLRSRPVGEAIEEAGFGSASRVYGKVDGRLGMTPDQYRKGGQGLAISYAWTNSALGPVMMAATDRGVCFVQFGESSSLLLAQLTAEYPRAEIAAAEASSELEGWLAALSAHLAGDIRTFHELPLDVAGTAFQMKVWRYLQTIPSGEVQSYAEVARGIGAPNAVRAAASACARNSIAVLIPCHRVLRGTGALGGYRWGHDRKRALLDAERKSK